MAPGPEGICSCFEGVANGRETDGGRMPEVIALGSEMEGETGLQPFVNLCLLRTIRDDPISDVRESKGMISD